MNPPPRNAFAAAETGEFAVTPTPEQNRKFDLIRQNSVSSIAANTGTRLGDLMEVDNEQETVRSISELKRKLEDISRKTSAAGGVDNPNYETDDDFESDTRGAN